MQVRSLVEPIRKIIARLRGQMICGKATDLVMSERLVEVETAGPDGSVERIYVPCVSGSKGFMQLKSSFWVSSYDKLIIAVGSVSSTHGVSGLEHCFQLKTISDAQAIRRRIMGAPIHTRPVMINWNTAFRQL